MSAGGFFDASIEPVDGEADFLVVGSGAGGGAAARVLAASGRSVIVLEEGPRVDASELSPFVGHSMPQLFRYGGHTAALGRAAVPILQGRVVGGTTFVNSAIIWRIPEKILAAWGRDHGLTDAFPAADLDAAYRMIEEEMHVRPVADEVNGRSEKLMRIGAEGLGIESRAIRRSEHDCRGSGRCVHGCPNNAKQSTAINYLRRAVESGARVYSNAIVERVLLDGGRAVGVAGRALGSGARRGTKFRLRARRAVVVCASVVQSPNLLRRSGVARGHAHLGEHFMAHPGAAVMGIYRDPVNTWTGPAQGFEAYGLRDTLGVKFESINVPPEVTASRLPGAGRRFAAMLEKLPYFANWACAVRADAVGSVRPSRLLGGDIIRYNPSEADLARMRMGMKRLAEMHFLAGAVEVLPNIHGMPETLTSPDQVKLYDDASVDPRAYSMVATHLFGTCRAGVNPSTSIVDPQLKVHGVDALYVMDASVFPTNTGVNPQHGIMAAAAVAASRLAAA